MDDWSKGEVSLVADIVEHHYVELTSKTKREAAEKLKHRGLVRVYEHEGSTWAKAMTYDALQRLRSLMN